MSMLAIQGHSTRGSEVIAFLKMLGGKNPYGCNGLGTLCAYHIIEGNIQVVTIEDLFKSNEYILYSLEGILAKFPYKVGYKVIYEDKIREITKMVWEEQTNTVAYKLDDKLYCNVINELQPYKEETTEKVKDNWAKWDLPKGYEFQDKDGNIINTSVIKLVKKQSKYPTTYVECAKILDCFSAVHIDGYKNLLLEKLQELLVCRDAYWKIAGEQMGLGKSWKPDWNEQTPKYTIVVLANELVKRYSLTQNFILAFPTEEMRDAFYDKFKELIETCKELL